MEVKSNSCVGFRDSSIEFWSSNNEVRVTTEVRCKNSKVRSSCNEDSTDVIIEELLTFP